ncbi:MAG: glycosyltransferase, partial [Methanobacteriota archaeon]
VAEVIHGVLSTGVIDRLLVVDDGSTDGTLDKLEVARREWPQIDITVRRHQKGLGSALLFGFGEVLRRYPFERLVVLDGDLSHDPATGPRVAAGPSNTCTSVRTGRSSERRSALRQPGSPLAPGGRSKGPGSE